MGKLSQMLFETTKFIGLPCINDGDICLESLFLVLHTFRISLRDKF